jgi:hypothetical protein
VVEVVPRLALPDRASPLWWRVAGVGVDLVKWIVDASIWRQPFTRGCRLTARTPVVWRPRWFFIVVRLAVWWVLSFFFVVFVECL